MATCSAVDTKFLGVDLLIYAFQYEFIIARTIDPSAKRVCEVVDQSISAGRFSENFTVVQPKTTL